jgi:hypothetical protein
MRKLSLITLFILSFTVSKAQDEDAYTDEELTTYAKVMVWAEAEKGTMTDTYNDWINNNEQLSAQRFLDIKNANGDSVKIQDASISVVELAAFELIQTKYDSMTSSFKDVYIGKIKGDIGAGLYNRLKKSLKTDAEIKTRYETIVEELKTGKEAEEEGTE